MKLDGTVHVWSDMCGAMTYLKRPITVWLKNTLQQEKCRLDEVHVYIWEQLRIGDRGTWTAARVF
jgi:hypothetical protein